MGSSIFKDYDVRQGSTVPAGPGRLWKIHTATNKLTNANCAVWVVERKSIEHLPKQDVLWNVLKRDMEMLSRLRFPLIVRVSKPVEDVKSAIFAETEPVTSSLSSLMESKTGLDELEVKLGLIQICESIAFVHSTAQLIHLNICPSSIIICGADWKLAGFANAVSQRLADEQPAFFDPTPANSMSSDRSRTVAPLADSSKPSLNYTAPEVVILNSLTPAADMFSLGCLIYQLFGLTLDSRSPRRLLNCTDDVDSYRRCIEEMVPLNLDHISPTFRPSVEALLVTDPTKRPTAADLLKSDYFNDTAIKTLQYLSHMGEHDDRSKAEFLKGLKIALGTLTFSNKILQGKFIPPLLAELRNTILVPLLLPNLFSIAEMLEKNANAQAPSRVGLFGTVIFPALAPLASLPEPFQIIVILLQRLEWMSKRISEQHLAKVLVPMACSALDHTNPAVVALALKEVLLILPLVDHETIRTVLFPRVVALVHSSKTPQQQRVQALFALSKLLPFAARNFIETTVLQSVLHTLTIDRSATTITSIAGVCDAISLKLGPEFSAFHLLPSLAPLLVDAGLNRKQFETLQLIINGMVSRIAESRKKVFDEAEARAQPAPANASDAERLQAFSAQLPPVSAPIAHSSSQPALSRPQAPIKPAITSSDGANQDRSAGSASQAKGAAAFNALLVNQEKRKQAAHEEKQKSSLLDLDYVPPETTQATVPKSAPSAFSGFDQDLFSLSAAPFNMDAFVLPPVSGTSSALAPMVSAPIAASPLSPAGPMLPSHSATTLATPAVMPLSPSSTGVIDDDDFFDPRAMSKPKSTPDVRTSAANGSMGALSPAFSFSSTPQAGAPMLLPTSLEPVAPVSIPPNALDFFS